MQVHQFSVSRRENRAPDEAEAESGEPEINLFGVCFKQTAEASLWDGKNCIRREVCVEQWSICRLLEADSGNARHHAPARSLRLRAGHKACRLLAQARSADY